MCDQINAKSLRQGKIIRFPQKTSPETPNVTSVAAGPGLLVVNAENVPFFGHHFPHFLKLSVKHSPGLLLKK